MAAQPSQTARWLWWGLVALALFMLLSLIRTVWLSRQVWIDVQNEETELQQLRQSVNNLAEEVQIATSSWQLERRARQELRLQRPDETVIRVEPN